MVELFGLKLQSERLAVIIQNSSRYLEIRKDHDEGLYDMDLDKASF